MQVTGSHIRVHVVVVVVVELVRFRFAGSTRCSRYLRKRYMQFSRQQLAALFVLARSPVLLPRDTINSLSLSSRAALLLLVGGMTLCMYDVLASEQSEKENRQ